MGVADRYAKYRNDWDPEFKKIWNDKDRKKRFDLSSKLIALRLKTGMNQTEFAQFIGVKQPYLSRLENGDENISYDRLEQIVNKVGARLIIQIEYKKELI